MHIQFSQSRPQGARLIAHVVDKGKLPAATNAAMRAGAQAARFKGNAGQTFDGFVEEAGEVARLALTRRGLQIWKRPAQLWLANTSRAATRTSYSTYRKAIFPLSK